MTICHKKEGSKNEKKNQIIKPLFAGIDFAIITELLSFLGQGPNQREKVDALNKILENEELSCSRKVVVVIDYSITKFHKT